MSSPNPLPRPKSILKSRKPDSKDQEGVVVDQEIPATTALAPQHIQIIMPRINSQEAKTREAAPTEMNCFNKILKGGTFLVQLGILLALSVASLAISSNYHCLGTPGLIKFQEGVGVVVLVQFVLSVLDYFYFSYHTNDQSGKLFTALEYLVQLAVFVLSLYGVLEVVNQLINEIRQDTLQSQSQGCDSDCQDQYSCDTTILYASLIAVAVGFIFSATLVYRIVNWYRLQNSSGGGNSVTID